MSREVIGQPETPEGPSRHWFVQEAGGENSRQLLIYADQMDIGNDATLRFYNADGSIFMEFPPGWWTNVEHGQD
jgi:hypothetical protein